MKDHSLSCPSSWQLILKFMTDVNWWGRRVPCPICLDVVNRMIMFPLFGESSKWVVVSIWTDWNDNQIDTSSDQRVVLVRRRGTRVSTWCNGSEGMSLHTGVLIEEWHPLRHTVMVQTGYLQRIHTRRYKKRKRLTDPTLLDHTRSPKTVGDRELLVQSSWSDDLFLWTKPDNAVPL